MIEAEAKIRNDEWRQTTLGSRRWREDGGDATKAGGSNLHRGRGAIAWGREVLNFNEENELALRWATKILNWSAHLSQTKAETYRRPFNLGRSGR